MVRVIVMQRDPSRSHRSMLVPTDATHETIMVTTMILVLTMMMMMHWLLPSA